MQTKAGVRLRLDMEVVTYQRAGDPTDFDPIKKLSYEGMMASREDALKALNAFFDEYEQMS
jgi:hypothetical protein